MKDSYLTAGITLGRLFSLLKRNPFDANPKTLARIAFLVQSAAWSSFFALIEKKRFGSLLKTVETPRDPVFIIGHWRTGSTLLHQFLSKDPELFAPTLFQVAVPDSFLVSHSYYRPVFKGLMGKHRPMDQVKIGMDEPQEDEYAIYRLTCVSPLKDLVFPSSDHYFLSGSDQFIPAADQIENWTDHISGFYKKLSFKTRKRIISKNPFNSMRIPLLYEIFPEARFIHIHRHPCEVIPSTIHMWDILRRQNVLNKKSRRPEVTEVATFMDQMLTTIRTDLEKIPENRFTEIGYDELLQDPAAAIRSIYERLNLPYTPAFDQQINELLPEVNRFNKNEFKPSPEEMDTIRKILSNHMEHYGYR